jgi:exopolysaccharide biosynthesis polyprenyl glycosylphosphotransferase
LNNADALAESPGLASPAAGSVSRPLVRPRHRDRDFALRRALLLADSAGLFLALALAMTVAGARSSPPADLLWMLVALPFWGLLFWAYRLYRRPLRRFEPSHLDDMPTIFHALVVGSLGLWVFYKLAPVPQLNLAETLLFGLSALLLISLLRVALRVANLRRQGPERVFAVAPPEDVRMLGRKLANHPEYEMTLVGAVECDDGLADLGFPLTSDVEHLEDLVASHQVDHLLVRLDANYMPQEQVQELMHACHREGVRFGCFTGVKSLLSPGIEVNHIEATGILTFDPPILSRTSRMLKRCMDIAISVLLLVLLAPLIALIALMVRLDSKGPTLYRQTRVGKNGRRFELLKFRTMALGSDCLDQELMERSIDPDWLVMERDPRVTRVGRFLRPNSLDELPQLWNVVRGEMSLVGPRPLSERDDEGVSGWRRHRLDLVPGITGYWQVLGRNNISFREMLEIDYAYVACWSLWQDLKLLARTVPAVLRRRGAN